MSEQKIPIKGTLQIIKTYRKETRPRGKESTDVQKSQIKGKESENSYQELKRSRKGQAHMETESRYFNWHGRLPQSKESVPVPFVISSIPGKSFHFPTEKKVDIKMNIQHNSLK